ncbi:MAG: O-antigen ligase family protein [Rhodospirillales bacterium]|nr:O-antigen ligase family protein [Rhodospirillales bacterium]
MSGSRAVARAAYRRTPAPPPLHDAGGGLHGFLLAATIGFLLAMLVGSLVNIRFLPLFLAAGTLLCVAVPVIAFPVITSAAWLLVAGTSPEMWLGDLIGSDSTITAVVKVIGLALLFVCMLRYGGRLDRFNPSFAYMSMFVIGLMHGLWPTLTLMGSVRSLIGSAAPFAFSFSRLSRRWCNAIITATIWNPPVIIAFGALLAAAHLRPLFTGLGGAMRLQGSTHPAFLGGFAATAIYAALVELYRDGRTRNLWGIIVNYVILVLSGARAPLAAALLVTAAAFFTLPSGPFPARRRLPLVLLGMLVMPVLAAIATGSNSIRLLNVLSQNAENLSGRNLIWPLFERAWNASPVFGWGIGAGKAVVDPDSLLAKLLGTTAAHNEYLRMGVDGGYFGLGLLILMIALWAWWWTRRAPRTDRFIMRAVFIAFAIHSFTDNTLIAATASVMFTWVSAVFARAALEREEAEEGATLVAQHDEEAAQVA